MLSQKKSWSLPVVLFCLGCLFVFPLKVKAADDNLTTVFDRTQKYSLENGLTVLISPMPSSSVVSVYGLVKTGSALEGKYLGTGISHFMEHMLFKGTEKRAVGQIPREVQAMGGEINASTGFDHTIYTITVPQSGFDQALDILADMLMNSRFDPVEIEKEREVVYGEIRLYKDRPERHLSESVMKTVFTQHPYRIPIIGYEELLRGLKNEDFVQYYRERYIPDNTIISVAGKVDPKEILPKIKEAFKTFERKRLVLRNLTPEPQQVSPRRYEEEYPTDLIRATMAYQGVSLLHEDLFALDVLAMILGQGESSRLYLELFKKQGLVQSISSLNFTPMDQGAFEIDFLPSGEDVDKVIAAIKGQIRLVQQKDVDPAELEKTKRQALSSYFYGQQTSGSVASGAAVDEAFSGDYAFSQKYVQGISKVTVDDIKRVANQYLNDDSLSVVVLRPKQKNKETAAGEQKETSESTIQKLTLDNGMTILLKENKALPIVSMNLVLQGGVSQEPDNLNGVSELTARTWTDGTKSKSAEDIALTVESRGASVGAYSGRYSFGLKMELLSQDINFGLDLLEDLVKNPAFDEKEFAKEKDRLRTSIRAQEDQIGTVTGRALRQTLFQSHHFRREPLGTLESIEPIAAKDAREFYERFKAPKNMVLSVFGNFDQKQVLEILEKKFSDLKDKEVNVAMAQEPAPEQPREKTLELEKKQAMVMAGFQGPSIDSPDRYGVEVLTSLLGSSFSGRLFNRIREELGNAYTLGGSYTPGRDLGLISFYVLTNQESLEKVRELLINILQEIQDQPVTEQELQEMKRYLKGTYALEIETNAQLGFTSSLDELYGLGYNHYQSYESMIDQITADDIQRLAKTYLALTKSAIVVAKPGQP